MFVSLLSGRQHQQPRVRRTAQMGGSLVTERPDIPKWTAAARGTWLHPNQRQAQTSTSERGSPWQHGCRRPSRSSSTAPRSSRSRRVRGGPPLPTLPAWTGARSSTTRLSSPAAQASSASRSSRTTTGSSCWRGRRSDPRRTTGTLGSRSSVPFVGLRLHEPTDQDMLDLLSAHSRASAVCARPAGSADGPRT